MTNRTISNTPIFLLVCSVVQCFPVPARHRSVPSRSVPFRSPSPFLLKNGTEERNGTERFQFWEERNDEAGRSVPKLALQEKWMENPLKWVKNPNFFALRISFKKIKGKNFKK